MNISVSQDTYNKMITAALLAYFMVLYAISWYTGKPIDFNALVAFLVPVATHAIQLVTQQAATSSAAPIAAAVKSAIAPGESTNANK